jgi:hypothetical protein
MEKPNALQRNPLLVGEKFPINCEVGFAEQVKIADGSRKDLPFPKEITQANREFVEGQTVGSM